MTVPTTHAGPIQIICRYRVKPGQEAGFRELVDGHWNTLHQLGLTTDDPARVLPVRDGAGNTAVIEMFSWKNPSCVQTAHETPDVMKMWEPMGALCEDMEFWHVQPCE